MAVKSKMLSLKLLADELYRKCLLKESTWVALMVIDYSPLSFLLIVK